ncbi:TylF/MycF family methyltransferase [Patescibacteria group bacterium]|nr:TylF/MycF family methyltransferase [Patescibacteria group bacterium]
MGILELFKGVLRKNTKILALARRGRWMVELLAADFVHPDKFALFLKLRPYTMIGYKRLSSVYELARKIECEKIPGAFAEFGVWKGGAAGCMAAVAHKARSGRKVWLFDSFEGLPEPTEKDGELAADFSSQRTSGKLKTIEKLVGPREDAERLLFSILRIPGEQVRIEEGWFQNTVPHVKKELGRIAILRLDADWYESTKYVLEELYEQVAPGGYVIFDDYGDWEGCRKAVDEFFAERGLRQRLIPIDGFAVYFQKL